MANFRTRMAPSPTGEMHVGSMAILLKNYALAKQHGGQFVLRIEDTDRTRMVDGAVERIQQDILDYGLDWDEGPSRDGEYGPYIQSERLEIYQHYVQQLVDSGHAYHCFCTSDRLEEMRAAQRAAKQPPKYDRYCLSLSEDEVATKLADKQPHVIRLKVPRGQQLTFVDKVRGDITFNTDEIDDQVLLKSDGFPTYHLAVVVDDYLMKITHILRGEEWISSTPKHVLLYEAFGWELPVFAHIPLFLNPDGKGKMSKRKGTVSARSFLDQGYLPEALLNFFMILGWTPHDQRELLSLDEYIQEFDLARMSKKSVVFDLDKLDWINGQYIRQLPPEELRSRLKPFIPADFPQDKVAAVIDLIAERLVKLSDFAELTDFFYQPIKHDLALLLKKGDPELVTTQLQLLQKSFDEIDTWSVAAIEAAIRHLQETNDWKKGQFFMMVRIAVSGRKATPPLFEMIEVLGPDLVQKRLAQALSVVSQ